ncbi:cupin domain-containing protein [Blastomonas sp. AAP53]|uniref:cupin domain-containing protein n=1 Tax=Blastomonas sp. AAP53 TaxID=1248760 RepID=UPI0002F6F3AA|nr:cupin domain-containing protein [Blastomonas sp. AAP53]
MSAPASPPVRRIVTGHDAGGRAIIRSDDLLPVEPIPSGDAAFSLVWTTATVPADNNDETDGRLREAGLTLHQGSVIRIVDMVPGGTSPFHRSSSIDYGIVLSGAVELELDDGAVTTAQAGDIIVQRGTIHLWRNPSATETCRIVFVLIEAAPVTVDGVPLPDVEP